MRHFHNNMFASAKALIVGATFAAALSSGLNAADLQERLVVTDAVVRLSDIFTDTGAAGETIVMEAPAPGKKLPVSNYDLVRIAKTHKVAWDRPAYLKRVYIHREGSAFSLNELGPFVLEQARQNDLEGDVDINIFGRKTGLYLPQGYTVEDIEISAFQLSTQRNRFSAILLIPTGLTEPQEQRITGTIEEVRLVPMFNRVIAPGEVISKADLEWKRYPIRRIVRKAVVAEGQLVGQTVKRPMPAGKLLVENDITMPVVIAKGSIALMTYTQGRLTLTMQGRALENGGSGDTIRMMNQKSKKTVFAVVVGSGHVEVATAASLKLASR